MQESGCEVQDSRRVEQSIASNGDKRPFNAYIKTKTKSKVGVGPLKIGAELISGATDCIGTKFFFLQCIHQIQIIDCQP